MTAFGNAWLAAFLLAAVAALADAGGDSVLVARARGALFAAVFATAPFLYLCLWSPRLPKTVFLPPLLFLVFSMCGGMPLPLWVRFSDLDMAVSSVQVVVAAFAWLQLRVRTGSWWLTEPPPGRAGPRRWLEFALVCGGAVPLALLLYVGASASAALHHFTGGFVRFDATGLIAEERRYVRPGSPDGPRVRLIPMVHIGRSEYYDEIESSLPGEGTLVLAEGMTDAHARLEHPLSYAPVASALGLEAQEHALVGGEGHDVENADLDVSALSPETLELVEASGVVLTAESREQRMRAWDRVNELVRRPGLVERAAEEVIGMRNRHLLGRLDAALERYAEIVIPWGAAHMPELERGLLERGFVRRGETSRAVWLAR